MTENFDLGFLLLAAGEGKRLRPITDNIPKPLIKINGIPLIFFQIFNLVRAGVGQVIVNLYHMGDVVEKFLLSLSERVGIKFEFLHEPYLFGTGGTIKHIFLTKKYDMLFVMNSDILIDFDILKFIHEGEKMLFGSASSIAHLLICRGGPGGVEIEETQIIEDLNDQDKTWDLGKQDLGKQDLWKQDLGKQGLWKQDLGKQDLWKQDLEKRVFVNLNGFIREIRGEGEGGIYTFTGVHIIKREILKYLGGVNSYPLCIVRHGYIPSILAGEKISFSIHSGFFFDAGTPERLHEIHKRVQDDRNFKEFFESVFRTFNSLNF